MTTDGKASKDPGSIQSIVRVFHLLSALNQHNGASTHALAALTGLPRGTVYRMLSTLTRAGYLRKDQHTSGYWIEAKCKELASGYLEQSWVLDTADEIVQRLWTDTRLSVVLSTPDGDSLVVRIATILRNPAGGSRTTAGTRVSLGHSVSGHVYLAHCSQSMRVGFLDRTFAREGGLPAVGFLHNQSPIDRAAVEKLLDLYRRQGYGVGHALNDPSGRTGVLAVPVMRDGQPIAALGMNFYYSSMKPAMLADLARRLTDAAGDISSAARRPAS